MKIVKVLDQEGTTLVSDPINQIILRELVLSENSVSNIAKKLNLPFLKIWRKIQKLLKANLVEQTRTEKVGNIEKKLYRATATWFTPQQYFNFSPKNRVLKEAFGIYSEIQKELMITISTYRDIPNDVDPIDFSLFANMQAFAHVCGKPEIQAKIVELGEKLLEYNP